MPQAISTSEQAKNLAVQLSHSHLAATHPRYHELITKIKARPSGYVVFQRGDKIIVGGIGNYIRSREELQKLTKRKMLGYSGRAWFIRFKEGDAHVCHDMWSVEEINSKFASLFAPHVNVIEFREATTQEENQWFKEKAW